MVTLQDIDVALARAEALTQSERSTEVRDETLTCLSNARGMLRALGHEATAALKRMNDSLESLSDIAQER